MTVRAARAHDDARHCARIARRHARTFTLASWLLPPEKRRAAYAVYAFCREADDIVDAGLAPAVASAQLAAYERGLDAALAGRPDGPVFRELARAVSQYGIPPRVLHELVAGVGRDLAWTPYATWSELARYCEGVASTVGEMCTHVFGVDGDDDAGALALRYARTLGLAMQLTNILRDVGEDAARGRCYLPEEDLAAFGLSSARVLRDPTVGRDPRWRPLMAFEVGRARALYEAAAPGIALLMPDARRCATACATGYAAILDAITAIGYDTVTTRARVGRAARLALLWRCARAPLPRPGDAPSAPPHVPWSPPGATHAADASMADLVPLA